MDRSYSKETGSKPVGARLVKMGNKVYSKNELLLEIIFSAVIDSGNGFKLHSFKAEAVLFLTLCHVMYLTFM